MSLARLALRLATIEALRPTLALTSDGPWPTLAGRYVFDSRIDPIEDLKADEARPVICVYTDDDDGLAGQKRGGPPFLITADLVFETSVIVKVAQGSDPSNFIVGEPETDSELETSLDLIGAQIAFALLYAPCGQIWRDVAARRVHNPKSAAHRTSEEGARLARRVMTWKVEINGDAFHPAPKQPLRGLDLLPEPLRGVAYALPENSYGRRIIGGLIAEPTFPQMPVATPLETVGLNVKVADPANNTIPSAPNIIGEVDNLNP